MPFRDRADAGQRLGRALKPMIAAHPVVLGLPRGGVPVALEVARMLDAPLDVIVVRKLGVPTQPELAMGAIGEEGARVLNRDVVDAIGVDDDTIDTVERRERTELEARAVRFRDVRSRLPLDGRTVIVVDDGLATGSTARAAVLVARAHGAARVVLAVPVGPSRTCIELRGIADEVVCLEQPASFSAVGQFYRDFSQTTDDEVIACLTGERT
jgi:putative phosphoribosyl transferase